MINDPEKGVFHEPAEPAAAPQTYGESLKTTHKPTCPRYGTGGICNCESTAPADSTPQLTDFINCMPNNREPVANNTRPGPLSAKVDRAFNADMHESGIREFAESHKSGFGMLSDLANSYLHFLNELKAAAPRTQGSEPLKEWRDSVSAAIKTIPEFHSGEWVGDKEGWGFHFEVVRWLQRKREELEKQLAAQPQPAPRTQFKKDETTGQWYEVCGVNLRPAHKEDVPREFFTAIPAQKEEE